MLARLFGWGQKPQQEAPLPAQEPVKDYGPVIDFGTLIEKIEVMEPGTSETFKVSQIPAHNSQVESLKNAMGEGGIHKFDWHNMTVTITLPPANAS